LLIGDKTAANRAELQLMGWLAARAAHGSNMDVAVFACSKGADVRPCRLERLTAIP
jgi:hypothetical protein